MHIKSLKTRAASYAFVGTLCALVYAGLLIGLENWLPTWLANPIAFLGASLIGALGHSRFTFQQETGGDNFAKRWVAGQYFINLGVCTLLPLILPTNLPEEARLIVLVFTPTILNAVIWSQAARFSVRQKALYNIPIVHADDLGLSQQTNYAIIQLAKEGKLQGASLLVSAPATKEGAISWNELEQNHSDLNLCLHLCLTEGPSSAPKEKVQNLIDKKGYLHFTFGKWLLISLIPNFISYKKRIRQQLKNEIQAQLNAYKAITNKSEISLDGHQHIHLIPIILEEILRLSSVANVSWIRTTREPLPSGLPIRYWLTAIKDSGHLKWILLQILSYKAINRLRKYSISTNNRFSGVFFTGKMCSAPLIGCWQELSRIKNSDYCTNSILLAHPSAVLDINLEQAGFHISYSFARSKWRQKEWQSLNNFDQ